MKQAALPVLLFLGLCLSAAAQNTPPDTTATAGAPHRKERLRDLPYYENIIKTNLSTIALGNYGITYERLIARKISASLGYRFMPKTYLTKTMLADKVMDYFKEDGGDISQQLDKLQMSGNALTAEFRFYTGRRPGARGFYAGVYGRYSSFKYDYPYDFERPDNSTVLVPMKGKSSGFGGGVILGGQFNVHKRVVIDLFIIGAHYGSMSGKVDAPTDLSMLDAQEKADLKQEVESLIEIGGKKNITADVRNDGMYADVKLPFVGVRGLGLTVGVAF